MTTEMIKFDLPKNQSSIIKVLGVGGGGSNAVNHMFRQGIEGVDFIVCNTDSQALELSPVPNKMQLGVSLTEGRGAGSLPEVGRNSAIEDLDRIREILENHTKMLFITAGMGGGTGTGAAPVIAKISKELGILTVGIVTIPFAFEGRKRRQQAEEGIRELKQHVDTLLLISNDRLRELYGNLSVSEAFGKADNVLTTAAKGIAEIITMPGKINVDFADVRTVMTDSGVAIMGSGLAEGENRALKAAEMALSSPLLNDNHIRGAKNILLNITSGEEEVTMDEISEITDYIQDEAGLTAEIIWGLGKDDSLGGNINITLVATGFESGSTLNEEVLQRENIRRVIPLEEGEKKPQRTETPANESANLQQIELKPLKEKQSTESRLHNQPAPPDRGRYAYNPPEATEIHSQSTYSQPEKRNESPYQVVKPSSVNAQLVSEEQLQQKIREREQRLRELSVKLKTPEGLEDLEKQPAYVRRRIELSKVNASDESQISRYTLTEDEDRQIQIKSNNSFLHDNVD